MGVSVEGGFYAGVSEDLLQNLGGLIGLRPEAGKGVAQGVRGDAFGEAGFCGKRFEVALEEVVAIDWGTDERGEGRVHVVWLLPPSTLPDLGVAHPFLEVALAVGFGAAITSWSSWTSRILLVFGAIETLCIRRPMSKPSADLKLLEGSKTSTVVPLLCPMSIDPLPPPSTFPSLDPFWNHDALCQTQGLATHRPAELSAVNLFLVRGWQSGPREAQDTLAAPTDLVEGF